MDKKHLDGTTKDLRLKAKQHIDKLPVGEIILNYFLSLLIASYLGWSLGLIGNTIVFIFVTYYIAPQLADSILKNRINKYVLKNYTKMEREGKGEIDFFLYNQRYHLSWHHIDYLEE